MGRFSRNQFGQEVYVPSVEERGGPSLGSVPFQPPSPSDRESQYEDFRFNEEQNEQRRRQEDYARREQERERERQLRESEEYQDWDSAMDEWMASVKEYRSRLQQWRHQGGSEDEFVGKFGPEPLQRDAGIPERPSFRTRRPVEEEPRVLEEADPGRRKEVEKHKQRRSRQDALLNSPEAREMAGKVRQGTVSEEDFKTWWVSQQDSTNAHAWDVSIEGDAYQELWAQLNQDGITSRMAGDLSGKTKERGGLGGAMGEDAYPVPDPETRDALLAELEAEHNKRELETQARLAGRRDYTPRPFDPNSSDTYDRLRIKMRDRANTRILRSDSNRFIDSSQDDIDRAAKVHENLVPDEGKRTPEDLSKLKDTVQQAYTDAVANTNTLSPEDQGPFVEEYVRRRLSEQQISIDDPVVKDELLGNAQVSSLHNQGEASNLSKRVIEDSRSLAKLNSLEAELKLERARSIRPDAVFSTPETSAHEKAFTNQLEAKRKFWKLKEDILRELDDPLISTSDKNMLRLALNASETRQLSSDIEDNFELRVQNKVTALSDYWAQREKRTGKTLSQKDKLDDIRKNHSPMELYVDEKTQEILYKHYYAAALNEISGYTGDVGLQILRAIGDGFAGFTQGAVGTGAAIGFPGLTGAAIEYNDFLNKTGEGFEEFTKQTFGEGRSAWFMGLKPHQFRSVVSSMYQSFTLGSLGIGWRGIGAGFGFNEFGRAFAEGRGEGMSHGSASLYAGLMGSAEAIPAMVLGGTSKWVPHIIKNGKLSPSAIKGLISTQKSLKEFTLNAATSFGTEIVEESLTTIAQLFVEGSFIHEDKNFFSENIGPALLEMGETVFAQTALMLGIGGSTDIRRGRQYKKTLDQRSQNALNRMRGKLAPLVGQIRTSGSLSDRMAEVINRISPAGAAQLRKLREQGKQISRTAIEKLYGPEIAGRLTKLEQREEFTNAILGDKQRAQQEVIDNSPVLQESPAKVVEVEDQQTGEKNVVTVNVEQGQTAQEAVDEQVRTATGESPVVTAEPATETPTEAPTEAPAVAAPVEPPIAEAPEVAPETVPDNDARKWTPEQEQEKTNFALDAIGKEVGKDLTEVEAATEEGKATQDFARSLGVKLIYVDAGPDVGGGAVSQDGQSTGVVVVDSSLEGQALLKVAIHEITHGTGADRANIGLTAEEQQGLIDEYLSRGSKKRQEAFRKKLESDPGAAAREANAMLAERLLRDSSFRNRMLKEKPTVFRKIAEAIKKFFSAHPEVKLTKAEQKLLDVFEARLETTPTEATPAEKQQQKVDAAKQELKDALADVVRNPKILSGVPISDQEIRAAKAVFNYLYERAKQLGISAKDAAKQLYKDFNVKRGDDAVFDKQVSSAILKVDRRLKKEPPKEKPHTIRENDDGTFTLVSPLGTEVGVFKTLDRAKEAQKLIEQPGKTTPTPEGEFSDEVYSIKNANVDADLEALNLPKPTPAEELAFQETLDEAVTATTDDADSLVSDLLDNPRAPSPWENALLTVAYMRAKQDHDKAKQKAAEAAGKGGEAENTANEQLQADFEKYEKVYMASRLAGRESGRSLAFRRMMIREDYSLVNMQYEAKIANKGELSKEQKEEVEKLHKRIEELESELGDIETRNNNNKAEEKFKAEHKKIEKETKRPTRRKRKARIVTDDQASKARKRIKKRLQSTLTVGVDPEMLYDATLIGVNLIENGVNKFSAWSAQVIDIAGDTIKPHLKDIWKDARSQIAKLLVDETSSTLAQADKSGKPINYNRQARKIYKEFVAMGQDRDTALQSTHEVFNESVKEDFTVEQVRDFVSGYGVFKELSKEELEVQVREYVGELQQLAKIEAMLERGEAPLKTGVERRDPSDEERRLIKEVERLKKAGNYAAVDPEKALKTALSSIKTRLTNQIRDLQTAIDSKTPINNDTSTVELDAEAESLKKERDALTTLYKEMFPTEKKKLTTEQRIQIAEKALERAIERNKQRIRDKDIGPVKGTKAKSARLTALRAENDALLAELNQMRRANKENLTQEQKDTRRKIAAIRRKIAQREKALDTGEYKTEQRQSEANMKDPTMQKLQNELGQLNAKFASQFGAQMELDRQKAAIRRRIADYKLRLANGDFSTQKRSPRERKDDDEMRGKRLELMNAKREFNKAKAKYEWDNMRLTGKAGVVGLELYDAVRTMKASIDFSGFRQAAFASMASPVMALKAGGKMFKGAWTEKARLAIEDELKKDPYYDEAKKNGIAFTERDGDLSAREEEYMSQWISSGVAAKTKTGKALQIAAYPYAVSERAFSTLLNVMRLEYYKSVVSGLPLSEAEKRHLAKHVNDATGRGNIGILGPSGTVILTRAIWAPKLLVSRWNLLTLKSVRRHDPDASALTKKIILKQYAKAMRSVGALLMLAAASRWGEDEEEWLAMIDPRSAKFGTIKIGDSYIDLWGGMKQLTVFLAKMAFQERRTWEGEIVPLDEGIYGQTITTEISRFVTTKLNPAAGIGLAWWQNYDMMGRPMTTGRAMYELISPLAPQEGLVAIKEEGIVAGTFLGLLGMMGASLMIGDDEMLSSYEHFFGELEGPKEKKKAERERKEQEAKDAKALGMDDESLGLNFDY